MATGMFRFKGHRKFKLLGIVGILWAAFPAMAQDPAEGDTAADACASIVNEVDLGNCLSDLRSALEEVVRRSVAGVGSQLTAAQKTNSVENCKTKEKTGSNEVETVTETEARCRKDVLGPLGAQWLAPIDKAVTAELARQAGLIRASKKGDTSALQRLQNILDDRNTAIKSALAAAVQGVVEGIDLKLSAGAKLEDVVVARTEAALGTLPAKATEAVTAELKVWQGKILAAHTPSDEFRLNEKRAEEFQSNAEKAALDEIRDQSREGFIRRIVCAWMDSSSEAEATPVNALACGNIAGLKVSGEEISKVVVVGIPKGAKVRAGTGEITRAEKTVTDKEQPSLSEGELDLRDHTGVIIVLHKRKLFSSTLDSQLPMMFSTVARTLQENNDASIGDPAKISVLHLLTRGRSPSLEIAITADGQTKTASIPLGYSRWKFETGGFMAVSGAVDETIVKRVAADNPNQLIIERVRKSDDYMQETGIFANFIPENYQKLGFGLGFATNSDGPPSVYLGMNMRLTTFGNRGLASFGGGLALRSVDRYPDLEARLKEMAGMKDANGKPVPLVLPPDSGLLTAEQQQEVSWFVGLSLGFRFGPIGSPDDTGN